jgi:hypothetical protein
MINVNQITAQLARMPDQALQRYAQMNKSDPYILSLALSESNRRKEMRAGAQMSAPEQPKVVDQAIAGMGGLPTLPADNLRGMEQTMAAGGIVAFDEGGEVPRYQYGGLMAGTEYGIPGMTQSTLLQDALAKLNEGRELSGQEKALLFASKPFTAAADVALSPINLLRRTVRNPLDTSPLPSMTPVSDARARALGLDQAQAPTPSGQNTPSAPVDLGPVPGSKDTDVMGGMPTSVAPRQTPPSAAPGGPRPPAGPAAVAPGAAPAAGIPGLITTAEGIQKALSDAQKGVTPEVPESLRRGIEDTQKTEQAALNRYVQSIRDEQAARQPAMKDFEERLKLREERLGRQERDLGPLAILQAGMAIMGGSSPFAAVNIGAGAQVGIDRYTKGAEKLEAARDKLDDAFGRIEEIRRNESRLDAKELREALLKAEQPAIEAKKTMFNALHEDWKLKRADASKGVELLMRTQMDLYKEAEQTKRAQIVATANDPLALYRALGQGDVEKGYQRSKELAAAPKTDADIRETWAKSVVLRNQYPNVEDFVRIMKGQQGGDAGQFKVLGSRPAP